MGPVRAFYLACCQLVRRRGDKVKMNISLVASAEKNANLPPSFGEQRKGREAL